MGTQGKGFKVNAPPPPNLKRMKTLDEIMVASESDKASVFTRTYAKPHDYCRHLERFFEPIRDKEIKLAEIGVGGGESIRGWLEYFPAAHIYGVDLVSNTNEWNTPGAKTHPRYTFACGDQSDPKFWKKFIEVYGNGLHVVIDDGSHILSDTKKSFNYLWESLKSGGIYEIEDLGIMQDAEPWIRELMIGAIWPSAGDIDSIYFSRELAILRKK